MKKRDKLLIVVILLAALVFFGIQQVILSLSGVATRLQITVGGEVYGVYELREDQTIEINATNICRIQDGHVTMEWADCPDQICVRHSAIDSTGGNIVCLPNRIFLSILDAESDGGADVVAS